MSTGDASDGRQPERWAEIDALFEAVLARPSEERLAYLAERARHDPELGAAVRELLEASERAEDFLESPAAGLDADLIGGAMEGLDDSDPLRPGERVGAYMLIDLLGRGGAGAVFLAERDDGEYRQRVAIKVLRRGLDTDELLARFRAERQILASLSHPNIARLLDGGATRDGRPYLVMECLDGVPITEYCDRHRLSIRDRIRLGMVVARTVQYAHSKLIVHRDLKPSNILVAEPASGYPGDGHVQLLDFGIAKLLDPSTLPAATPATRTEVRLMTPEYASPEQVRGEMVTTATDVYQLGILLYELLTDRHPHPVHRAAPAEIERVVCHQEARPPSASVLGNEDDASADVANRRGTEPQRLHRLLRGDLDTIILKALQKDPERRYGSVEQLGDDLERYLDGRPITARPDARLYRLGKLVRRHPLGSVAAGLIGLFAAGYLATISAYADRLESERDRARLEAAKAEQVAGFLVDIFQVSEPGTERGDTLRARTLLDRGAERIRGAATDDPALRARMLEVIGIVYRQLGAFDGAESALEEALRLRQEESSGEQNEVAASLRELALLRRDQGALELAEALAREAVAIKREELGSEHEGTALTANVLAQVLYERGAYDEADALYREALDVVRQRLGPGHAELAGVLNNLGTLLRERGDPHTALTMLREALALREELLGPDHPSTAVSLNSLGNLLRELGEMDEAATLFVRSLDIRRRQLGDDHPAIGTALNNLALIQRSRGDYSAADSLNREALALRLRLHGEDHPDVGSSQYNLAETLRRAGRPQEAEAYYRSAQRTWRASLGADHPRLAYPMNGLAEALRLRGETEEAAVLLEQALDLRRGALGERHPLVASTLTVLALLHRDRDEFARAEARMQETIEIRRDHMGEAHPDFAHALMVLGNIRITRGDPAAAEPLVRQALNILEAAAADVEPRLIADAQIDLARVLLLTGRHDEARPHAEAALRTLERTLGARHPRNRVVLELLAAINEAQDRPEEAEVYRKRMAALR